MKNIHQKNAKNALFYAVTAGIIAVILLVNVFVGLFLHKNLLFLDMTPESTYKTYSSDVVAGKVKNATETKSTAVYELMDESVSYLRSMLDSVTEENGKSADVTILFCADPDILCRSELMRYIYYTALLLEQEFPEITVKTVDVWDNPSAVDAYRANSYSNIYQSNIIVSSGSEFRVSSMKAYYTYSDGEDDPWAFSIQKQFLRQIIAVTRAESPICCLTTNHGEPFANLDLAEVDEWEEYNQFIYVLQNAGYKVQFLNLETEEIPEDCRLIVTLDPQTDFKSKYGDDVAVSETTKLDSYLDKAYSYMIITDADTPTLPNMEEYLTLWGITYKRNDAGECYRISDITNQMGQDGNIFYGTYASAGPGESIVSDMLTGVAPKTVFSNATPIVSSYEKAYVQEDEDEDIEAYTYGSYYKNGVSRSQYTVLSTTKNANGVTKSGDVSTGEYALLTITSEATTVSEGQGYTTVSENAYVVAIGSVDFVSNQALDTKSKSYGNTDTMLSILRAVGKEVVPVGVSFVTMYDDTIDCDSLTEEYYTTTMIWLTALPVGIMLFLGGFVLIRRKIRH